MAKKKKKGSHKKSGGSKNAADVRKKSQKPVTEKASSRSISNGPEFKRTIPGGSPLPAASSIEAELAKMGRHLEGKDFESIDEMQRYINSLIEDGALPDMEPSTPEGQAQELIIRRVGIDRR